MRNESMPDTPAGERDRDRPRPTQETAAEPAVRSSDTATGLQAILQPPMSPEEGLGWLAHFRIIKVLGRGGMGMVFEAQDSRLQRTVALKIVLPEFATSTAARQRFVREARAAAALKNDHIVTVFDVDVDKRGDVPYLAMEYLEGQSLEDRLTQGEPMSMRDIVRVGREVATGLAAAHAQGLIHRDIKPANIWLETRPEGGFRVKVLDFGLARMAGAQTNITQTGGVVGTPEFMSPEQARGQELDARSDLFSLGAVLYTMCSGRVPFEGSSVMAVLTALAIDTPRPVHELNPETPPALVDLIERLMRKTIAERPGSAAEVRDALADIEASLTDVVATRRVSALRTPRSRRPRWLVPAGVLATVAVAALALVPGWMAPQRGGLLGPPIKIGVLHSRTGTMQISERPVFDAVLLAIDDINAQGGALGRPIEPVLADGQSDEEVFAKQAEKLIATDKVAAIFGCWTSASRKAVVPVVEKHDHLLLYPVQYEGVEQSPNVVYLGPTPNQQILPALRWLVGFEGKRRWFLVGSDYVFPATANAVIREEARSHGCTIVDEQYLPLASVDVSSVVKRIADTKPDLIINTINGDTNVAFFRALRKAGISAKDVPTVSFSISEQELNVLGARHAAGDYVASSYFQSLDTPANKEFVRRFTQRFGTDRVVSTAMQAAYAGVHLWAQAVRNGNSDDVKMVRMALKGQTFDAPQGILRIDPENLHTLQYARVGKINDEGQLAEVYASPQPIPPVPYPAFQSRTQWQSFLAGLKERWGGHWSNQGL